MCSSLRRYEGCGRCTSQDGAGKVLAVVQEIEEVVVAVTKRAFLRQATTSGGRVEETMGFVGSTDGSQFSGGWAIICCGEQAP